MAHARALKVPRASLRTRLAQLPAVQRGTARALLALHTSGALPLPAALCDEVSGAGACISARLVANLHRESDDAVIARAAALLLEIAAALHDGGGALDSDAPHRRAAAATLDQLCSGPCNSGDAAAETRTCVTALQALRAQARRRASCPAAIAAAAEAALSRQLSRLAHAVCSGDGASTTPAGLDIPALAAVSGSSSQSGALDTVMACFSAGEIVEAMAAVLRRAARGGSPAGVHWQRVRAAAGSVCGLEGGTAAVTALVGALTQEARAFIAACDIAAARVALRAALVLAQGRSTAATAAQPAGERRAGEGDYQAWLQGQLETCIRGGAGGDEGEGCNARKLACALLEVATAMVPSDDAATLLANKKVLTSMDLQKLLPGPVDDYRDLVRCRLNDLDAAAAASSSEARKLKRARLAAEPGAFVLSTSFASSNDAAAEGGEGERELEAVLRSFAKSGALPQLLRTMTIFHRAQFEKLKAALLRADAQKPSATVTAVTSVTDQETGAAARLRLAKSMLQDNFLSAKEYAQFKKACSERILQEQQRADAECRHGGAARRIKKLQQQLSAAGASDITDGGAEHGAMGPAQRVALLFGEFLPLCVLDALRRSAAADADGVASAVAAVGVVVEHCLEVLTGCGEHGIARYSVTFAAAAVGAIGLWCGQCHGGKAAEAARAGHSVVLAAVDAVAASGGAVVDDLFKEIRAHIQHPDGSYTGSNCRVATAGVALVLAVLSRNVMAVVEGLFKAIRTDGSYTGSNCRAATAGVALVLAVLSSRHKAAADLTCTALVSDALGSRSSDPAESGRLSELAVATVHALLVLRLARDAHFNLKSQRSQPRRRAPTPRLPTALARLVCGNEGAEQQQRPSQPLARLLREGAGTAGDSASAMRTVAAVLCESVAARAAAAAVLCRRSASPQLKGGASSGGDADDCASGTSCSGQASRKRSISEVENGGDEDSPWRQHMHAKALPGAALHRILQASTASAVPSGGSGGGGGGGSGSGDARDRIAVAEAFVAAARATAAPHQCAPLVLLALEMMLLLPQAAAASVSGARAADAQPAAAAAATALDAACEHVLIGAALPLPTLAAGMLLRLLIGVVRGGDGDSGSADACPHAAAAVARSLGATACSAAAAAAVAASADSAGAGCVVRAAAASSTLSADLEALRCLASFYHASVSDELTPDTNCQGNATGNVCAAACVLPRTAALLLAAQARQHCSRTKYRLLTPLSAASWAAEVMAFAAIHLPAMSASLGRLLKALVTAAAHASTQMEAHTLEATAAALLLPPASLLLPPASLPQLLRDLQACCARAGSTHEVAGLACSAARTVLCAANALGASPASPTMVQRSTDAAAALTHAALTYYALLLKVEGRDSQELGVVELAGALHAAVARLPPQALRRLRAPMGRVVEADPSFAQYCAPC
ncbi:hypothetical protein JKP88DRAFT_250117 [Tribonema minus]|uniref:Uncharacterized protein n=1 Tax=Tribonema minus TaxID=303371 RepID=A0A835YJ04_9STRA|nr:hypothetical protein JKP88DRAFT_250117 [Tribonema minus]